MAIQLFVIHSPVNGHLGFFQLFVIMNEVAMNSHVNMHFRISKAVSTKACWEFGWDCLLTRDHVVSLR